MILLRKARIYDTSSRFHLKQKDILIEKGKISKIASNIKIPRKIKVLESKDLCVSPGWLDIGTYNGEPGFEYREDLNSLRDAAAAGGYCSMAPFPTGTPTIDNKGQLHYLLSRMDEHPVKMLPIAALSKGRKGEQVSELIDLYESGAIAFSDGFSDHLSHAQLLRSLLYLKSFEGLAIYSASNIKNIQVNEGKVSVSLGLKGSPAHHEETNIRSALAQSQYADSTILIHNISTSACIKERKNFGKNKVDFSVPFMNLIFNDEDLVDFSLNLKVSPPIRDSKERKALCKAVESGRINIITSNHRPLSIEEKDQPFGLSKPGAATIESVFSAMNGRCKEVSLERLIYCLTEGPYNALNIECARIQENKKAQLTIFDPSEEILIEEKNLKSKSKNNPFIGHRLKGKVLGIISDSSYIFN